MKRFYKSVSVERGDRGDIDVGTGSSATQIYKILLDGRVVRTPAKSILWLPTLELATAIAAEWQAQEETIDPTQMDLLRVANAAVDRVVPCRDELIADLVNRGSADLVCYRAETPAELVQRQSEIWQPLVDWAQYELGAKLTVATGIMPIKQATELSRALADVCGEFSDHQLAAISLVAGAAGSIIISLALAKEYLSPGEAVTAAALDDIYQAEHWGEEQTATERRMALIHEIEVAARYLSALRQA